MQNTIIMPIYSFKVEIRFNFYLQPIVYFTTFLYDRTDSFLRDIHQTKRQTNHIDCKIFKLEIKFTSLRHFSL